MRRVVFVAFFLAAAAGCAHQAACPNPIPNCPAKWSYCDSNQWLPPVCQMGDRQSPIDLTDAPTSRPPDRPLDAKYTNIAPNVANTSRSIKVLNPRGSLTYRGETYNAKEFHFHVPGEHTINGTPAAMELHIVHEHGTRPEAAALTVLFDVGTGNTELQKLVDLLPITECCTKTAASDDFDLAGLLPKPVDTTPFYVYDGSLTTPECSQNVRFLIFQPRLQASQAQIDKIAAGIGPNARQARHPGSRPVTLVIPPSP